MHVIYYKPKKQVLFTCLVLAEQHLFYHFPKTFTVKKQKTAKFKWKNATINISQFHWLFSSFPIFTVLWTFVIIWPLHSSNMKVNDVFFYFRVVSTLHNDNHLVKCFLSFCVLASHLPYTYLICLISNNAQVPKYTTGRKYTSIRNSFIK